MAALPVVTLLLILFLSAGCQAARPVRQLLCFGDVSFSGHQALALQGQKLVMGHVKISNSGKQSVTLQQADFKLSGQGSNVDGSLKCPGLNIPTWGSIQCGFVAKVDNPQQISGFQPVISPQGGSSCSPQPLHVKQYTGGNLASADASSDAFADAAVINAFAEAAVEAFGGNAKSVAKDKVSCFSGDAFALATAILHGVFGGGS